MEDSLSEEDFELIEENKGIKMKVNCPCQFIIQVCDTKTNSLHSYRGKKPLSESSVLWMMNLMKKAKRKGGMQLQMSYLKVSFVFRIKCLFCCLIFFHCKPTGSDGEDRKRDTGRARREKENNVESTLMKKKKTKKISAIS